MPRQRSTFALASALFFLSGMLGLGYELVWVKKSALIVGASQIALSTVLTAFFLGLGLGSLVVGRLSSRRWSPLVVYGFFEMGVGVFALLFPALFRVLEAAYGALYPLAAGSAGGLFAVRFLLLFALFLPPTFFMGATLPLLLDGLVERDASIGSRTSLLYGINILGAVAGVLLTSYLAIPRLGMDGTSLAGGAANLAIGVTAALAFRGLAPAHPDGEREALDRFFPAAAFASGLIAISYQIAWARYFSLFNTGTVYLTAILLAVYLLALAAGSLLLAPLLAARWSPLKILAALQALVPVAALGTLEWWRAAEYRFAIQGERLPTGQIVARDTLEIDVGYRYFWRLLSEDLDGTLAAPFLQVALVVFLPVVLLGAGLPSLIAAAARSSAGLRSVSGRVVFWNTLGSSAGGFLCGYALLPLLGLHWTLAVLGVGSAGLSVAAHWKALGTAAQAGSQSRAERRREPGDAPGTGIGRSGRAGLVLPAIGLLWAAGFALGREDITRSTIKLHGYGRDPDVGYDPDAPSGSQVGRMPLVEVVEGPLTTSFLFEDSGSVRVGSGNVCLAVAYKGFLSTQALQGHIPCLFYPGTGAPQDCLGICLGSGQSFGALLLYPIRRLDVVDISSEIVEISLRRFEPYNHRLATDPRVRLHLDDGRHFVERAPDASYDVVSMEPPPPTAEGVYSLYSVEFYSEVARVLREGGVFMQWLPLYRVTPLDAKGIVKTQASVFPDTFVVKVWHDDFMILSYKAAPTFQIEALRSRIQTLEKERLVKGWRWSPRCGHDLATLEGVLALLVMGPEDVRALDAPLIYRDDDQALSYSSGDRWLLRRYEGPALSSLSFAALKLTPFEKLAGHFAPPLDAALASEAEWERARAFSSYGVPEPQTIAELRAVPPGAGPAERARRALLLAQAHDRMLAKEEAYRHIGEALDALEGAPALTTEEHVALARKVVRHAIVAYEGAAARWLAAFAGRFRGSPLLAAMQEELASFRRREAERLRGYWLLHP
ncbi:MAG: hypothetical protein HY721_17485 [Planctomycetes bacterium]|nr:hypothetical protein [Planctomycetota bacterium]